jgi:hypothetical protein
MVSLVINWVTLYHFHEIQEGFVHGFVHAYTSGWGLEGM